MRPDLLTIYCTVAVGLAVLQPPAQVITDSVLLSDSTKYAAFSSGDSIEDLIRLHLSFNVSRNAYVVERHLSEEPPIGHDRTSSTLLELKSITYNADAVVAGTLGRCVSALTKSHQFVFTDCEVAISKVYSAHNVNLDVGSHIVVSRAGGELVIDGRNVLAIEPEFPSLQPGNDYIFFVHFNADSRSFVLNPSDVYAISGEQVSAVRLHSKVLPLHVEGDTFIRALLIAIDSEPRGAW